MPNLDIQKDFIEGTQEIFTTLFNFGKENKDGSIDGVSLYLLSDNVDTNVYGETKNKTYQKPKHLVVQVILVPTIGEQDVEYINEKATFVITYKSLLDNKIDVSNKGLEVLRKGLIKYKDTFYLIDNILPKAYVEDVFLFYHFVCTEIKGKLMIKIED